MPKETSRYNSLSAAGREGEKGAGGMGRDDATTAATPEPHRMKSASSSSSSRSSHSSYASLLDAALDAIILIDHESRVIEFNPAAERTFGYSRAEALGQDMAELVIPPSLREAHRAGLTRYLATGEAAILGKRLEITGCHKDGTEFPVEVTVTRLAADDNAPIFAGFVRDISQRRQDEERLAVQYAVSRLLVEAQSVEQMTENILPAIGENLGWDFGALWEARQQNGSSSVDSSGSGDSAACGEDEGAVLHCTRLWRSADVAESDVAAFEAATRAAAFTSGVGIPGRVLASREPLWVGDVLTLPNVPRAEAARAAHLRSAFAFPIRHGGKALGVIEFFSRDIRPPDEDMLRVVEIIGNEVGQFLQHRQLEAALKTAYTRQTHIADALQEALRPVPPGKVPGLDVRAFYQPALDEASIGGDFYDVFALEKGCFAFIVADLSGKGLAAASQIATVRHMLRALLYLKQATLSEALSTLNDILVEHDLLTGFATLFAGAYDANARTLTYVSCGQEPGLIRRAAAGRAEGAIEELPPTGAVLGGFAPARYEERVVPLFPGDVLALFTDGLTEAGAVRAHLLGLEGVAALLRSAGGGGEPQAGEAVTAEAVVNHLIQGLESFATPAGIRDDVCLLIARVE